MTSEQAFQEWRYQYLCAIQSRRVFTPDELRAAFADGCDAGEIARRNDELAAQYDAGESPTTTTPTRWTVEAIRELLDRSDLAVARGLVRIWELQTEAERLTDETSDANGVGFAACDAAFGSSLARQASEWLETPPEHRRFPSPFSVKQMVLARRLARKYAGQLARLANASRV